MSIKRNFIRIGTLTAALALTAGLFVNLRKNASELDAYAIASLPTTIDLNDCEEQDIRDYYSDLNYLDISERQGTNLLKNLKPILANNQKYYSYDSNTKIWQMYEITDRDWAKSPASSTVYGTYNSVENKIYNYVYGQSESDSKNNPYIHALYVNRNIDNQATAWDDHDQDAWGINQEHIWAKSHGFDTKGSDSSGGARGDPMHLWAGNGWANHEHSNYFFAFVDKDRDYSDAGTKYGTCYNNLTGYSLNAGGNETVFEPQTCDKGDIARAIFYLAARYNYFSGSDEDPIDGNNPNLVLLNDLSENDRTGTSSASSPFGMGLLSDLLAWNKLDPVDEYEVHRNNLLYKNYTNNRNPFIDFPNWADAIWGTADLDGTNYNSTVTTYASPSIDPIGSVTGSLEISDDTMEIIVGDTAEISAKNALGVIDWTIDDDSIVSLSKATSINKEKLTITALSVGTTTITASCDAVNVSCTVTVRNPTPAEAIERTDTATTLSYRYTREDGREPTTDTLNKAFAGVTGSSYDDWENDGGSAVTYKGFTAGSNNAITLKSTDHSGIIVSSNYYGANALNITVTWESHTANDRTIDVYGKNEPYSDPSDLYSNATKGTKIGSIVKGEDTELLITENYKYIGIRSNANTLYASSIEIGWSSTPPKYAYSDVSIRFGGYLSQDLWNGLNNIEGFGVLAASEDIVNEGVPFSSNMASAVQPGEYVNPTSDIVDYYKPIEDMMPAVDGNNYYWNLFLRISEMNLDTYYIAAAYIKTSTGYVFFKEAKYSVKSLASDYINNRGYDDDAANGSLYNLAVN